MRTAIQRFALAIAVVFLAVEAGANDEQIASQIQRGLRGQQQAGLIKDFDLKVRVQDRVVSMQGVVTDPNQRDLVLDLASRIQGVEKVINQIQLAEPTAVSDAANAFAESGPPIGTGPANMVDPIAANTATINTTPYAGVPYAGVTPAAGDLELAHTTAQLAAASSEAIGETPQQPVLPYAMNASGTLNSLPAGQSTAGLQPVPGPQTLVQPPANTAPAASPNQIPRAFARSNTLVAKRPEGAGIAGVPTPVNFPGTSAGAVPTRYDQANMPGYAWPSYAAYPNYAALAYPQQYSAAAWPYIGPFYPYPQVPLGWRKVTLEWDDGWWFLDFHSK